MAHDFSNTGQVITGPATGTAPGADRLPEMPRPDFYLMHHPDGWEPVEVSPDEWEWLPKLKRFLLVPGVNGVRSVRGGVDDGPARINFERQGFKILPRDLGYVTKYTARNGRPTFYASWEIPVALGNRVAVRMDDEHYIEFRRGLVQSGVVAPPEPEALDIVLEDLKHRINRNGTQIHIPGAKAVVDKATAKKAGATKAKAKATKKTTTTARKRRATKKTEAANV
tara:strand:+ start:1211 stop:1885 length:675 start_codon:yes stop_codon:yes gene_type:complete